mmetsp:Transcript_11654/g.38660  ORF Transcript_11654/g.38660 Transcript_11654/m.38660 type:complete len:280 (-) Transcript_11654:1101-1940(-)
MAKISSKSTAVTTRFSNAPMCADDKTGSSHVSPRHTSILCFSIVAHALSSSKLHFCCHVSFRVNFGFRGWGGSFLEASPGGAPPKTDECSPSNSSGKSKTPKTPEVSITLNLVFVQFRATSLGRHFTEKLAVTASVGNLRVTHLPDRKQSNAVSRFAASAAIGSPLLVFTVSRTTLSMRNTDSVSLTPDTHDLSCRHAYTEEWDATTTNVSVMVKKSGSTSTVFVPKTDPFGVHRRKEHDPGVSVSVAKTQKSPRAAIFRKPGTCFVAVAFVATLRKIT